MASAPRRPEGCLRPIGARQPRPAECFIFPFRVIFDAANRKCGTIDQDICKLTNNELGQQTRARDSSSRLGAQACLPQTRRCCDPRGGNGRNMIKSLADKSWADHAPLGERLDLGVTSPKSGCGKPGAFCAADSPAESDALASRCAEGARRSAKDGCKIVPGYPSFGPRGRK